MPPASAPVRSSPHIVDVLIAERAPRLTRSAAWPLVRPGLYALLGYRKARHMADAIAPMSGEETLRHVSELLHLKVEAAHLERLPAAGRYQQPGTDPPGVQPGRAERQVVALGQRGRLGQAVALEHVPSRVDARLWA